MIVLRWIFWLLLRLSLGARYRIRVVGKEQLDGLERSVLLLPNHPAYIASAASITLAEIAPATPRRASIARSSRRRIASACTPRKGCGR